MSQIQWQILFLLSWDMTVPGSPILSYCKWPKWQPMLLALECWELLRPCWQWCAKGCNNSQHCWDLQWIVGRIQPIRLCRPCVMGMHGPNSRALRMDSTLLRYASAITKQKKCWELFAQKFDQFQTLHNNFQQRATTCNRVCRRT